MTTERHHLWKLLDTLQMDLRAANAKLVEIRSIVAGLNLVEPEQTKCPRCGIACKGPRTLAEHVHVSHGGPVPEHYLAIDALVSAPAEPSSRPRAQASAREEPEL